MVFAELRVRRTVFVYGIGRAWTSCTPISCGCTLRSPQGLMRSPASVQQGSLVAQSFANCLWSGLGLVEQSAAPEELPGCIVEE